MAEYTDAGPGDGSPSAGPDGLRSPVSLSEASSILAGRWGSPDDDEEGGNEAPPVDDTTGNPEMGDEGAEDSEATLSPEDGDDGALRGDGGSQQTSLDDFIQDGGYDKGEFLSQVTDTVEVDGARYTVNLHEMRQGYQRGKRHQQAMAQLDEERSRVNGYAQQVQAQWQDKLAQADEAAAVATALLDEQRTEISTYFDNLDAQARTQGEDPGAFAARQVMRDRATRELESKHSAIQQKRQEASQQAQQQQQARQTAYVRDQQRKLLARRPEWADEEVRMKAGQDISTYLAKTYGYTPQEVSAITDHRANDIIWKARLYDLAQSKAGGKVASGIKSRGGLLKAGRARRPVSANRQQMADLDKQSRESGSLTDAAALLSARMAAAENQR